MNWLCIKKKVKFIHWRGAFKMFTRPPKPNLMGKLVIATKNRRSFYCLFLSWCRIKSTSSSAASRMCLGSKRGFQPISSPCFAVKVHLFQRWSVSLMHEGNIFWMLTFHLVAPAQIPWGHQEHYPTPQELTRLLIELMNLQRHHALQEMWPWHHRYHPM